MTKEITNPIKNSQYCDETISLLAKAQVAYLVLAQRLHEIKNKKLYLPRWETFQDFCMEMNELSTSQVSRLIGIHEKFTLQAGVTDEELSEAGWTKVAMTLPIVNTKDEAIHWLEKAKTLTRSDLAREIKEFKTGKNMADCEHEKTYLVRICEECGDKRAEYDIATINPIGLQAALEEVLGQEVTYSEAERVFKAMADKAYETGESVPDTD